MPKIKTFKTYKSFWKAISNQVPKTKHWLISGYMVRAGYAIKERIEQPVLKVSYSLKPGIVLTEGDVTKVVNAMK